MQIERERKYLVSHKCEINEKLKDLNVVSTTYIQQAYIHGDPVVRVRISKDSEELVDNAVLCFKKQKEGSSIDRYELEMEIPLWNSRNLIKHFRKGIILSKTRYGVMHDGNLWEIDIFHNELEDLVLAEVEVPEGVKFPELPPFLKGSRDVTDKECYTNYALAMHNKNVINILKFTF